MRHNFSWNATETEYKLQNTRSLQWNSTCKHMPLNQSLENYLLHNVILRNHPPVYMVIQVLRRQAELFKREVSPTNGSACTGQQNPEESVSNGIQARDSGIPEAQSYTHHHSSMISYKFSNENSQKFTFFS